MSMSGIVTIFPSYAMALVVNVTVDVIVSLQVQMDNVPRIVTMVHAPAVTIVAEGKALHTFQNVQAVLERTSYDSFVVPPQRLVKRGNVSFMHYERVVAFSPNGCMVV